MIIDCKECEKEISHKAISCPYCGWRLPLDYQDKDDSDMKEKVRWKRGVYNILGIRMPSGRETKDNKNELLFYIYNDGSIEKIIIE